MTYTKDDLRQIFQKPFNANEWQQILQHYFHATELRAEPELIDGTTDDEQGYYLGAIDTTDSYRIGLFYYQIRHGNVVRKRVGLRNLVKSFINPNWGEFDAALVVFDSGSAWRLSFVCDIKGENTAPKRHTYVFGESDNYYHTPVGRFNDLQRNGISFENIKDAFSVERLNEDFFNGYKERYVKFLNHINDDTKENRDYVKKLLGRLVFLQFLQKKGWMGVPANQQGWIGGDKFYLNHLIERYENNDRLLSDILERLFFKTLNTPRDNALADPLLGENIKIPYLNGGLFDDDELDNKNIDFPYDYFKELMDFFAMYNFTIDENDPEDSEIGIDPEMLGHIFENLLEDNKDKGAFYTPKEIVQYMSEESVSQYLKSNTPEELHNAIDVLIKQRVIEPILQNKENARLVNNALCVVKVCDPAIGSGAFPMGVLNVLFDCRHLLYGFIGKNEDFSYEKVKRDIIQNNIFGVDIEQGAVDIARLRFWLTLVVDSNEPQPLPNLDYKITCGNSQICRFALNLPINDVFEEYNHVGKENAKKTNSVWSKFSLKDYRELVMDYTEAHTNKNALRLKINEIKTCFKSTLAKGDINKRKNAEKKVYEYEFISLFGKRKADEDPIGYANAKATLRRLKEKEQEILNNKKYDNSFEWRFEYPQLLDDNGNFVGFDIVIANPPYIKEGRMSKLFFEPYKDSPYYKGKMDIWYLFACNGLDLLNENGILCFIATNNWVTSFGASKLRNKVIKETRICNIVDFGAVMMFESASIQTMIMLFQKDSITDDYSFDYRRLKAYRATEKDAAAILTKTAKEAEYFFPTIRRANFIDKSITFSKSADILGLMEMVNGTIHLFDEEIAQGIVPNPDVINSRNIKTIPSDEILLNDIKVGDGVFVVDEGKFVGLNEIESKYLKNLYEPTNCHKYYFDDITTKKIIYITKQNYNHDAPTLLNHLGKYRSVMEQRRENQNGRLEYYHLHWPRSESYFKSGEKILVPRKSATPIFTYTKKEAYVMMAINIIKTNRVNMKYLIGLLNSKLIEFWLKNKGKMQGANYQLDKEPLMQIPIAVPDRETQDLVAKLVKIIILLKSSKQRASNLVSNDYLANEFSHIIDGCVYEIYFPNEMSSLDFSFVRKLLTQTEGHPIDLESVWQLYSAIDKSGIIESIKSLSFSKSEVLKTISLS